MCVLYTCGTHYHYSFFLKHACAAFLSGGVIYIIVDVSSPITVGNFAFLFNCTLVGRTLDSMTVPT